ncbi:MAG: fructose-6-phosphate aldolase [Deltaproteobacteria bacterium RIFCSPLOWO2_12_FULL_38_8]|nr:MAG: fructose-6-phosphate aldolase [Deltaproteobacteria bacterium RIFCSPLOWO2_12_FULL_38_8]
MKFFIDTADIKEIKEASELGILDGVTTNPSLIAKTGRPFKSVIDDICKAVNGPISVETTTLKVKELIEEGKKIAKIHKNVVVKLACNMDGLKACKALSSEGIKVNVTLCFSPTQALFAAKAGATYISPFVGRLDDISHSGMDLIQQIVTIYKNYNFKTEVLVASIRHPLHVVEAALMGAHVATMPFNVITQLFKHPLTDIGLERFLKDWEKVPKNA